MPTRNYNKFTKLTVSLVFVIENEVMCVLRFLSFLFSLICVAKPSVIGDIILKEVHSIKFLGRGLIWDEHIDYICAMLPQAYVRCATWPSSVHH